MTGQRTQTIKGWRTFTRFRKDREGAAAIEFALLAIPFLMLIFATFETFFAFAGEQLMANAVDTMARKIRTGEITFGQGKATDVTEVEFRQDAHHFGAHDEIRPRTDEYQRTVRDVRRNRAGPQSTGS